MCSSISQTQTIQMGAKKRKVIGNRYNFLVDKIGISRVNQIKNRTSVFSQYTILTSRRNKIREKLNQNKIPTSIYYPKTINSQTPYKKFCCPTCTPNAIRASKQVLSLPMSPFLKILTKN